MASNNRRRIRVELRIWIIGVACLLGLGALAAKVWWLQVAHGMGYTQQMRKNAEVTVRIPACTRGNLRPQRHPAGDEPGELRGEFLPPRHGAELPPE
ncbi:MAG: hypothetical protein QM796_21960 [Chthoniobacteraceae bacterium]